MKRTKLLALALAGVMALALLTGLCIFGGVRRISAITSGIVQIGRAHV